MKETVETESIDEIKEEIKKKWKRRREEEKVRYGKVGWKKIREESRRENKLKKK